MTLESLGTELQALRKAKKWSQHDLENYSGITKRTLSKMENGFNSEVGILKVEMVLDLLGYELCIRVKGRPKTLEELQDERQ